MRYQLKPNVKKGLFLVAYGAAVLGASYYAGSYFLELEKRVQAVENHPVQQRVVVLTPTPTATPSATIVPVKRLPTPTKTQ